MFIVKRHCVYCNLPVTKSQTDKGCFHEQKKRKIITAAAVILAVIIAFPGGIILKSKIRVAKLEKLSMDDSATAKYAAEYLPDKDTIFGYAQDLYNMGVRMPGTPEGEQAQSYVKDKFTQFGLENIEIIPSKTKLYTCENYSLSVNGENIDCCYINYSGCDGSDGTFDTGDITAQLVYVGSDTDSDVDVKGKIVVAEVGFTSLPYEICDVIGYLKYDPNNTFGMTDTKDVVYLGDSFTDGYFNYMEKGAAGYIGILTDYYDTAEYLSEDYTYYGDMTLPGMWVSNTDGTKIRELIDKDSTVTATLSMNGSLKEVDAGAVVGYVKGKSDETIMVQSHYDSITKGAVEDASGMACMLALAEMYSQIPSENLEKSILFIATDTHFSDYDTHDAVVEKLFGDDGNIVANLCIEHICEEYEINDDGTISDTGEVDARVVFVSGSKKLISITNEEFVRHGMDRTLVLPATLLGDSLCTDADEFYQEGVPVVNLISSPVYLYSSDDTIDKIPEEQLVPTCETMSDILWRLMELSADEIKN